MVPSPSMAKTIEVGDFLLVNKLTYGLHAPFTNRLIIPVTSPKRGNLIVFRSPVEPDAPQPEANYFRIFPKWMPLLPIYWCKADNPRFNGHRRGFVTYTPRTLVKRCVALAGDTVEIRDKRLFINGRPAMDSFVSHVRPDVIPFNQAKSDGFQERWESMGFADNISLRDNFGPVVIPPGHVMALGDNRDNSWDSRFWGPVDLKYVRGKPMVLYMSYGFPVPPGRSEYNYEVNGVDWPAVILHPFRVRLNRIGHILS